MVLADESINPRQMDVCNILKPWRKVVAIDEDELVIIMFSSTFAIKCGMLSTPPPPPVVVGYTCRKMKLGT